MADIKFETLKRRAKALIGQNVSGLSNGSMRSLLSTDQFIVLMHMAIGPYLIEDRPALCDFARAFDAPRTDHLADLAKWAADKEFTLGDANLEIALIALRAREEAHKIVDRWDVRRVATLIELFPSIVPTSHRKASVTCYVADNDSGDWMVSFDTAKKQLHHKDERLGFVARCHLASAAT